MPEMPELEAVRAVFNATLRGARVARVELTLPIVIRYPAMTAFAGEAEGTVIGETWRRGKFLGIGLEPGAVLVVNPMLTGRFWLVEPGQQAKGRRCFSLELEDGRRLVYVDQKVMGKVYLVPRKRLDLVPGLEEMGPEILSLDLAQFRDRLRRHNGQVKNILVNAAFAGGVGNAYADEILWQAKVHPYRRRASLAVEEVDALHAATQQVLREATETVAGRMGERTESKIRDFLAVHGKGGQPCPRCGGVISQVTAAQRLTNFCRTCQPDF